MLLKSYEAKYIRKKASVFTKEQFCRFIYDGPNTGRQLQMKAMVAFCGGLRCADLVSLETPNLEFNDVTGCWVKYVVSKQRGENMVNKFNVPLNYVQYFTQYCDVLKEADLYIGRLFKS